MDLAVSLIQRHGIDCDLALTGHLEAAWKRREVGHLAAEAECLTNVMGYTHVEMLDKAETHAAVATPFFHGALLDRNGGHFHPLNYTLGLADAARKAGVTLYENSVATSVEPGPSATVKTAEGSVKARYVLIACDAFLGDFDPHLAGQMMPVGSYIAATEPLPDPGALIATNRAVSDTKFVVDYFRLSADGKSQVDVIANATDLTDPKAFHSGVSAGEIYRSIRDGAGESMPPFSEKVTKEQDLWDMVNYLRSLWPEAARPKLNESTAP
jgi:gamma-glutamylputrescine oxidase